MLDLVGYTERFDEDFKKISAILNIEQVQIENKKVLTEPKAPCDPQNMTRSDYKYLDRYDRKSIETVNELYADDFHHFGYQMLSPSDFPEKMNDMAARPNDAD